MTVKQHDKLEDVAAFVVDSINEAATDGRFMVAVWSVDAEDKLRLCGRSTWQFPTGLFDDALRQLRDNLDKEATREDVVPPLPVAELIQGINLPGFGNVSFPSEGESVVAVPEPEVVKDGLTSIKMNEEGSNEASD
jgi:hypothetical protein